MKINPSILTDFFRRVKQFRNENGIIITVSRNVFRIRATVDVSLDEGCTYELYDVVAGIEKFIRVYAISDIIDLERIDLSILWLQYTEESAEMIFTDGDSKSIHFRKFRSNTMAFDRKGKKYIDHEEVMNRLEDFKSFIEQNYRELKLMSYRAQNLSNTNHG
jgi:hypothetical protein